MKQMKFAFTEINNRSNKNQLSKEDSSPYGQVMKPKPLKKPEVAPSEGQAPSARPGTRGTPGLNYTEIAFDDTEQVPWKKVVRSEPRVEYCQINPFTLPPKPEPAAKPQTKPKPEAVYNNVILETEKNSRKDCPKAKYENVTPEILHNKYENVSIDIPESQQDQPLQNHMACRNEESIAVQHNSNTTGSCLTRSNCKREKTKPVPTPRVSIMNNSVTSSQPAEAETENSDKRENSVTLPCPQEALKPPIMKAARRGPVGKPWLMGRMTRQESEALLLYYGKSRDFLMRESINREGDFTLCILYDNRVRHFPIQRTSDNRFLIGKNTFKDLAKIVKYYQSYALFYDATKSGITLGNPVTIVQ